VVVAHKPHNYYHLFFKNAKYLKRIQYSNWISHFLKVANKRTENGKMDAWGSIQLLVDCATFYLYACVRLATDTSEGSSELLSLVHQRRVNVKTIFSSTGIRRFSDVLDAFSSQHS